MLSKHFDKETLIGNNPLIMFKVYSQYCGSLLGTKYQPPKTKEVCNRAVTYESDRDGG